MKGQKRPLNEQAGSRPIRLSIVNPFGYELFDPDARASKVFGGAEVQLYYLATALAADDTFDVSMIVERPPGGITPIREGVRMLGVAPTGRHFARLRDRIPVPSLAYLAAMRRADADVYLQRGGAVLTGDVATHCRLAGRRFVFMAAHDWDCDRRHQQGQQYLAGAYYTAGLHSAHRVFAQSNYQQAQLLRHHHIESTVQRTVYPAYAGAEARREHVLWVGRCVDWKRPLVFLDLAATRPGTTFVMVCSAYEGTGALYERLVNRAAELPNVRFLDFVPFASTDDLFRRAIAFVNTSTAEGFPNTFVQATRRGTPVMSLDVNPDGVLEQAEIGACANGDTDLLAKQAGDLLSCPELWNRKSANCYRYFHREHDLAEKLPAFADALRAVAARAPR